jgi:hypothetical protein
VRVVLAFVGIWLLAVGARGLWSVQGRDSDGFYTSGMEQLATDSHALSSPPEFSGAGPDMLYARGLARRCSHQWIGHLREPVVHRDRPR